MILEQDEKKRQLAEELMDTMIIGLKSLEEEYPNNIFFENLQQLLFQALTLI